MNLTNKVALVTGGAIRVGKVIALELAKAGADVVISYYGTEEEAQATKHEIEQLGRRCLAVAADMRNIPQLQAMIKEIDAAFGRLDFIIHNAANFNDCPMDQVTEEIWDSSQEIICKGAFFLSQAAIPLMMKHKSGRMVALIGNSYYESWPTFIPHSIAKVGLAKMMQGFAVALSPYIQCNAICPADILSSAGGLHIQQKKGEVMANQDADTLEVNGQILRRGNPEEVAELVVYLCGCSSYMNGAVIPLDGGKNCI